MKPLVMKRRQALLFGASALLAADCVFAQSEWPRGQAIRLVVPFTAGSGTDIVARLLAEKLGPALGATVIVENRPGAGGTVGAALVAKAPADGYTLLVHSAGHLVNPSIYPSLSYDTLKDFAGITPLASLPNVLVTAPGRFADVRDLVEQAKSKPGRLNYGSAGNRLGDAHERRGIPLRRRHAGAAHAVQGHAGSDDRDDGRPHRLVLRADGLGAVADPGRQAQGAGRRHREALGGAAAGADDRRGRRARLRIPVLGRPVRAGEDAVANRRPARKPRWPRS